MKPKLGDTASISKEITDADLRDFARLSLDANPVHLDDDFAATTIFGRRIAHGLYVASFISAVLANELPGPGTIYLSQELKFTKPAYIGDVITAAVTVTDEPKPNRYLLNTSCTNQAGDVLVQGTALVLQPAEN